MTILSINRTFPLLALLLFICGALSAQQVDPASHQEGSPDSTEEVSQLQQVDQSRPTEKSTSSAVSFRNFRGASLFDVIDLLARQLKINYILDPGVTDGAVTINTYGPLQQSDLFPLLETILHHLNLYPDAFLLVSRV